MRLSAKIFQEKQTVSAMVRIYCHGLHHGGKSLCAACGELEQYAHCRLDKCSFGDGKPSCAKCPIHCYQPEMRERVKEVMRFAGPRMMYKHPFMALRHLWKDKVLPSEAKEKKKGG